jgi:hypothetical protein
VAASIADAAPPRRYVSRNVRPSRALPLMVRFGRTQARDHRCIHAPILRPGHGIAGHQFERLATHACGHLSPGAMRRTGASAPARAGCGGARCRSSCGHPVTRTVLGAGMAIA